MPLPLYVRDISGKNQRLRVPLIEAKQLGAADQNTLTALPAEVRQQLQDGGFDVNDAVDSPPCFSNRTNAWYPW